MKRFLEITITGKQDSHHPLARNFQAHWNLRHPDHPLEHCFTLLLENTPLAQELLSEFERFNAKVGRKLTLRTLPRIEYEPKDYKAASFFVLYPRKTLSLQQQPSHPSWVYQEGTMCRRCGAGTPLSLKEYVTRLREFGLERPHTDFSVTEEFVTIASSTVLDVIEHEAKCALRTYPVTTRSKPRRGARKRKGSPSYHVLELLDVAGAECLPATDVRRDKPCTRCGISSNTIHKGPIYLATLAIPKSDLFRSRELFGIGRMCEWMFPAIFISRRLLAAFKDHMTSGFFVEPCFAVDSAP